MESKFFIMAVSIPLLLGLLSAASPAQDKHDNSFRGTYSNYDYAFAVQLPSNLAGYGSDPPNPNHGCGVPLDAKGQAYMWVDGSYNAAEWRSLEEAVDVHIGYLKGDSQAPVVELMRKKTKLAGLPAIRSVARHKDRNGTVMLEEFVMAMRRNRTAHDVEIVYTVGLSTPEVRIKQDRALFNKLWRSFALCPLP
jgi:hypothetical protein